jgi:hypothetical protein
MFWALKLGFVVDILAFFDLATFGAIFEKFGGFFNLQVTLNSDYDIRCVIYNTRAKS